jgi:hydroxymethylbilane synthase
VATHGDRDRSTPLACFGGFGAFVKALEDRLVAGEAEGAVHSLKDVPILQPQGLVVAAVLPRGSARDLLIPRIPIRSPLELPFGARIGTASLRRGSQLRAIRPDLVPVCVRGNVDTRLRKLAAGECDALIMAEAGLLRLGREVPGAIPLEILPAPAQGAVALEVRAGTSLEAAARSLNHRPTWLEVCAERAALAAFGRGCALPFAGRAHFIDEAPGDRLLLRAAIYDAEGEAEEAWGILDGSGLRVAPGIPPAPEELPRSRRVARLDDQEAWLLGEAVWGVLADTELANRLLREEEAQERAFRELTAKNDVHPHPVREESR